VKNKEFIVGAFAVVALTLLYLGFNFLKGIDFFSTTKNYYAKYNNISQLTVSNPVLVNGFAVGRVSAITLMPDNGNKVLVELEIDSKVLLGKGAKATLNSDFLGSKSILLELGDNKVPINDKDTIQAEVAKGMFDMLSETASPVADNLQTTLRKLNTLMDNLSVTLSGIDPILKKFHSTPDRINSTIDKAGARIDDVSANIKSVSEKFNATLAQLEPTLKNFKSLSDSLAALELNQTLQKANQTLASLNESLAKLKKGDNTMGRLLTEDSLYVNLNKVLHSIDSLANHFNTHPSHFLAPLGKSPKKIERDLEKEAEAKKKSNP
jgi:phospholipid/cholesterol/gamma-HCH transport system substrate-binding protein